MSQDARPMPGIRLRRGARERGAALFLAILTLFILTIMGIALMFATSIENTLAGTETKVSKIFYAAESGVEYGSAMLSAQTGYSGGLMPNGVSSHYAGITNPDMQVIVSSPAMVGYTQHPGDSLQSGGSIYGTGQAFYEIVYGFTSTASSTATQANKAIDAEVGIYPKQLNIPKPTPIPGS
jgi:Tfp pilus assembly protein PilX